MHMPSDFRHWLLTWRTYGTWLPGDARGSTSETRSIDGTTEFNNRPGTPYAEPNPAHERHAHALRKAPIVFLDIEMARIVADQMTETAVFRGWNIYAMAVMADHVHVVVRVPGDPNPSGLLRDFKSYSSRKLNGRYPDRKARWWSESGSTRLLRKEEAILGAIEYVRGQANALVTAIADSEF